MGKRRHQEDMRKHVTRNDDVCVKCKGKYHSVVSYEIKDVLTCCDESVPDKEIHVWETKNLFMTRQCLECGHQTIIQREHKERSEDNGC